VNYPLKENNMKIKKRVFEIVEVPAPEDQLSKVFDVFIFSLIILNVLAVILETTDWGELQKPFFKYFEIVSVAIFSVEYVLRVWSCTENTEYESPVKGRIRFALTPFLLIDLAAILPSLLPMFIPIDLRFMRMFRLFRIFRILKLARYVDEIKMFYNVFVNKKEEFFITLFVGSMLLILSSCLMYFAEHTTQPDSFSSIPASIWWIGGTLIGYGDIYPVTILGKLLVLIIAILGIGMIALPAGILASGLMEEINKRKNNSIICPHCGKDIDESPET
jgi:voltage-gated potassium channel